MPIQPVRFTVGASQSPASGENQPSDRQMGSTGEGAVPPPGNNWERVMASMLGGLEGRFNERMDSSDKGIHTRMDKVEKNLGRQIDEVVLSLIHI